MVASHPASPHSFAQNGISDLCPYPFSLPPTAVTTFTPSFDSSIQSLYPSSNASGDTSAPSTPPYVCEPTAQSSTSFLAPSSRQPGRSCPPTVKNHSDPYPKTIKASPCLDGSSLSPAASSQTGAGRIAETSIGQADDTKRDKLRERNRLSKRAQRQRQVDHLAALEARAEQREGELAELRVELRSKEQVIAMLWERLRDSGKV